jgi:hypothetical protein
MVMKKLNKLRMRDKFAGKLLIELLLSEVVVQRDPGIFQCGKYSTGDKLQAVRVNWRQPSIVTLDESGDNSNIVAFVSCHTFLNNVVDMLIWSQTRTLQNGVIVIINSSFNQVLYLEKAQTGP